MEFSGGRMMETNDDSPFSLNIVKEERLDFDEDDKKGETSRRGRTRSLTKKSADKVDIKAKLERSRQSARECRARKKLRYQYFEEIISETEKSIVSLRRELDCLKIWAKDVDEGRVPTALIDYRNACVDRKVVPESYRIVKTEMHIDDSQLHGQEILRHIQASSAAAAGSSPASSGIGSASTSAGTGVTTMAFSPTGSQLSAFAAMMLNPSSLTHTISPT